MQIKIKELSIWFSIKIKYISPIFFPHLQQQPTTRLKGHLHHRQHHLLPDAAPLQAEGEQQAAGAELYLNFIKVEIGYMVHGFVQWKLTM